MTADLYCSREDLYLYGLARGMLTSPAREVATVYPSTDVLELDGHGFGDSATRTAVTFRVDSGGTIHTGLVAGTTYYAERLTDSTFQVYAAASGGSAINITAQGSLVFVAVPLPVDDVIEFRSRWCDDFFPAHLVPFEAPIPVLVRGITAQLAARQLMLLSGQLSGSLDELELAAKAQLARHAKGQPVRDVTATGPANLAITSPVTTGGRGWTPALVGGVEVIP